MASCYNCDNIYIDTINTNSAFTSSGFQLCIGITNSIVNTITNAGAGAGYGYDTCNRLYGCSGTGNKTALFNTCYFSSDNSVACAAANGNA